MKCTTMIHVGLELLSNTPVFNNILLARTSFHPITQSSPPPAKNNTYNQGFSVAIRIFLHPEVLLSLGLHVAKEALALVSYRWHFGNVGVKWTCCWDEPLLAEIFCEIFQVSTHNWVSPFAEHLQYFTVSFLTKLDLHLQL